MHFIVTGGAGFIGSHVTETLLSQGYRVTVVDNLSTGFIQNLIDHPNLQFIKKDVADCKPQDFSNLIDGVAHLAATPSVSLSWQQPLKVHNNNLSATLSVIELCKQLNIPKLVFASSASVYGNPIQLPILESHPTNPISPYGLQKLVSEQYGNLFAEILPISFIALRIFNVFGPRQLPNSSYSGVVSIFLNSMRQGQPITIYGDGSQTRDFIYVKDVANVFTKALTLPLTPGFNCCNVATGQSVSLLQLVNILKNYFPQWNSTINFAPPRPGDIQHSRADISRLVSFLNFSPQFSLDAAIAMLVKTSK